METNTFSELEPPIPRLADQATNKVEQAEIEDGCLNAYLHGGHFKLDSLDKMHLKDLAIL